MIERHSQSNTASGIIAYLAYLFRSSNIIDQYDSNMCTKNACKYHNNHMKSYEII